MKPESLDHTDNWLRYFREEARWSQQTAADAAGVSKVFYNRVEREQAGKHLSADKAERLATRLGKAVGIEGLSASDLFPTNGMESPRGAARLYFDARRARDLDRLAELEADDEPPPTVVPEDEYEHDMAKLDSPAHRAAYERYWQRQDPATYQPMELVSPEGRLLREHPPASFVRAMRAARKSAPRAARARGKHSSKRRSVKSSSSSSDDPGESEPPLAAATNGGQA